MQQWADRQFPGQKFGLFFLVNLNGYIDALGFVTVTIHTTSSGQGHETLVGTVIGEVLQIDPDLIRVVRPDTLACLPSNSPVGSRMAIMLGGAAFHAAQKLKAKLAGSRRTSSAVLRRT